MLYKDYSIFFKGNNRVTSDEHPCSRYAQHINDKTKTILDVGCGTGGFIKYLKSSGYQNVAGIEINEYLVPDEMRDLVIIGNLLDILHETPANAFDVICAFDVMEHLTVAEIDQVIAECSRVLREDGRIILQIPNANGVRFNTIYYGDVTHKTLLNIVSVNQLLAPHNFEILEEIEIKPRPNGIKGFLRLLIYRLLTAPLILLDIVETGFRFKAYSRNVGLVIGRRGSKR